MKQLFSQALVVARRDFLAIVGTPTFLIFLLAPFLMLGLSAGMGIGAASMAAQTRGETRVMAIAAGGDATRLASADARRRSLYDPDEWQPPRLIISPPAADIAAQARAAIGERSIETGAVLFGSLARPHILHGADRHDQARYLAELAEEALRAERAGISGNGALSKPVITGAGARAATKAGQSKSGVGAVFVIFLLTLLLAGQAVGTLAEEKSNKVIEILAASVRLEAVFLGKLIGMFGVAVVFISFWGALAALALQFADGGRLGALQPAIGLPAFLALCAAYFTMAFMLLGAIFLGIGAQASSMREIQMLSLPITVFQLAMFGLASAAASEPSSKLARFAQVFPFSSPFAMPAVAATDSALWPHALALAWQVLWVAIVIFIAARLFRLGVLKSGGGWRGVMGLAAKRPLTSL